MLATNGGAPGDIDVYEDTCGFVTYVINPIRGASGNESRNIGWMTFTITYTFSGLKRPGANLKNPQSKLDSSLHELGNRRDAEDDPRKNERIIDDPMFREMLAGTDILGNAVRASLNDLMPQLLESLRPVELRPPKVKRLTQPRVTQKVENVKKGKKLVLTEVSESDDEDAISTES